MSGTSGRGWKEEGEEEDGEGDAEAVRSNCCRGSRGGGRTEVSIEMVFADDPYFPRRFICVLNEGQSCLF